MAQQSRSVGSMSCTSCLPRSLNSGLRLEVLRQARLMVRAGPGLGKGMKLSPSSALPSTAVAMRGTSVRPSPVATVWIRVLRLLASKSRGSPARRAMHRLSACSRSQCPSSSRIRLTSPSGREMAAVIVG